MADVPEEILSSMHAMARVTNTLLYTVSERDKQIVVLADTLDRRNSGALTEEEASRIGKIEARIVIARQLLLEARNHLYQLDHKSHHSEMKAIERADVVLKEALDIK